MLLDKIPVDIIEKIAISTDHDTYLALSKLNDRLNEKCRRERIIESYLLKIVHVYGTVEYFLGNRLHREVGELGCVKE